MTAMAPTTSPAQAAQAAPRPARLAERVIGVLGGMGPLATADFMREIILATPAEGDSGHIPLVVVSCPQIPDRVAPILKGTGESPLPAMRERLGLLLGAGARCIAMPCNTAHFWYEDLARDCPVPFLSIVDATMAELAARLAAPATVGLIGTAATLHAGIFPRRLAPEGHAPLPPQDQAMETAILPGIALVKKNRLAEASTLLRDAIQDLMAAGAGVVVLACTEVPAALRDDRAWLAGRCLDSTAALARACVAWALTG